MVGEFHRGTPLPPLHHRLTQRSRVRLVGLSRMDPLQLHGARDRLYAVGPTGATCCFVRSAAALADTARRRKKALTAAHRACRPDTRDGSVVRMSQGSCLHLIVWPACKTQPVYNKLFGGPLRIRGWPDADFVPEGAGAVPLPMRLPACRGDVWSGRLRHLVAKLLEAPGIVLLAPGCGFHGMLLADLFRPWKPLAERRRWVWCGAVDWHVASYGFGPSSQSTTAMAAPLMRSHREAE